MIVIWDHTLCHQLSVPSMLHDGDTEFHKHVVFRLSRQGGAVHAECSVRAVYAAHAVHALYSVHAVYPVQEQVQGSPVAKAMARVHPCASKRSLGHTALLTACTCQVWSTKQHTYQHHQ